MNDYNNFKDAGRKVPDYGNAEIKESKPTKTKIRHESLTIDADEFPYLQKLKVGSECELRVKIKKTGERTAEEYEQEHKDKEHKITFEILSIAEPKTSSADYKTLIKEGEKNLEE